MRFELDGLFVLVRKWERKADLCLIKSKERWEGLYTGRITQDDDIIYSVYELSAQSKALKTCSEELRAYLNKIKG